MAGNVANTTIKITDQASVALRNINIALSATVHGTEDLQKALDRNTAALNNFKTGARQATTAQKEVNSAARTGAGIFAGLTGKLAALAGAYLSVQTAQKFVAETDQYITGQARLKVMNDGLQTQQKLYDKIYHSAQRSIAPMGDVMANVTKLGIVAKDAFKDNDEIISFIEIFNKAATISGSSNSEKSNALYQLSQAFGSGRLQGDELRSVRENAPLLWKSIEKELQKQFGEGADLRKLAADGLISPQVIKNAAFASAKEVEKQFNGMAFSFGDYFIQAGNKIRKAMEPIFKSMMQFINSADFKAGINTVTNGIIQAIYFVRNAIIAIKPVVVNVAKYAWTAIKTVAGIVWDWRYAIVGVIGAFATLKTATLIYVGVVKGYAAIMAVVKFLQIGVVGLKIAAALATAALTKATLAQTAATWGLATAEAAALWWIYLIIAAVIAVAALVIWQLDYVTGGIYAFSAFLFNLGVGVYNWFLSLLDSFINPVINLIDWFHTAWTGGFEGIGGACLNILGKIVSNALSVIKPILEVWDYISDSNSAEAIAKAQKAAENWGKTPEAKKKTLGTGWLKNQFGASKDMRLDYGEMYQQGKSKGAAGQAWMKNGIDSVLSGKAFMPKDAGEFKIPGMGDIDKELGAVGLKGDNPLLKGIAGDVANIDKNTSQQDDDYKMIRDVMAQRAVSRIGNTGGSVKIEMTNNNSLASKIDISSFIEELASKIEEAAATAASGLHN